MNLRACILGTVAANLVLVAGLLWQAARTPALALPGAVSVTTNVVTEHVSDPAPPPAAVKIPGSPPFHWSQLESTNYSAYLTNLLAIGCPQETVRDLLEARLADDFRARLRELTRPLQARFWDVAAANGKFDELFEDAALEQSIAELKAGQQRIQAELDTALAGAAKPAGRPGRNEQFSHLPVDQQAELAALDERHAQARETLKHDAASLSPAERAAMQRAQREQQQAERRALFTDAEWDEAELRRSPQAAKVRELRGYPATPDELRALARSLREFDTAHPAPPSRNPQRAEADPDYQARLDEREAQRRQFLTARLGDAGFAAYERAGDPRFHTLLKLARRLELPPASAAQWLALQTTAQEQAGQTRQNTALPEDARVLAALAIRAEAERTLQAAVGLRGWTAYQRHAGDWLKQLGR